MTSYAEAAGAIECDFDPTDRAEALAALCARAVFQGTYGDDHPVVGSQRLADGVAALNTYDMSPRIVPFLTYAAGHPNTRYTPDDLSVSSTALLTTIPRWYWVPAWARVLVPAHRSSPR